jgi:hypothetical protein
MPEGEFRIERKAYQVYMDECKNGDMSYLRLIHPYNTQFSSNVIFFGANYD